jgi:uridine kinase
MTYELYVINNRLYDTPEEYVLECEAYYNSRVRKAANEIVYNIDQSHIVLLSGPSGSGKTTTAIKLVRELKALGLGAYYISLDNYFLTINPKTAPRTPSGEIDYESPQCLDMDLLKRHFQALAEGEEIRIPHFSFANQARMENKYTPMKLGRNEIAVFEGIHALNDYVTYGNPDAYKIYVSTLTDIVDNGSALIDGAGLRLLRRIVRDDFFRGADPEFTLKMWTNIRRGEVINILPYRDKANMTIDSVLPYEVSVMKQFTGDVFEKVPTHVENFYDLEHIVNAFNRFRNVNPEFVPADSLLREFIGGSAFTY